MISSVTARRTAFSSASPACRENSSGSPKRMRMRRGLGNFCPGGCASKVPIMAHGITGTPARSAIAATPTLPLYSRPSCERVPSG